VIFFFSNDGSQSKTSFFHYFPLHFGSVVDFYRVILNRILLIQPRDIETKILTVITTVVKFLDRFMIVIFSVVETSIFAFVRYIPPISTHCKPSLLRIKN